MSEQEKFLAAIKANPKDYFLRQAYADWLEENDQPEEADRQRRYEEAEKWMIQFAKDCGGTCTNYSIDTGEEDYNWKEITLEDCIQAGHDVLEDEWNYFTQIGSETARSLMCEKKIHKGFWDNWEIITGIKVTKDQREHRVFSCSC